MTQLSQTSPCSEDHRIAGEINHKMGCIMHVFKLLLLNQLHVLSTEYVLWHSRKHGTGTITVSISQMWMLRL